MEGPKQWAACFAKLGIEPQTSDGSRKSLISLDHLSNPASSKTGAGSKNQLQPASALILCNVAVLGVHVRVHQTSKAHFTGLSRHVASCNFACHRQLTAARQATFSLAHADFSLIGHKLRLTRQRPPYSPQSATNPAATCSKTGRTGSVATFPQRGSSQQVPSARHQSKLWFAPRREAPVGH